MNDMMKVGLAAATVDAYTEFFNDYTLKNDSLPAGSALPPSVLASRMIAAVTNLGDTVDNKLAIELAGQDRYDLDIVNNSIKVVLSDLTARERQKQLLSGKGSGLGAADPRRDVQHPTLAPRADGYVKPTKWSTGMRPCGHCLGSHMDDACELSVEAAAKAKADVLRKQGRNKEKKKKKAVAKLAKANAAAGSPAPAPAPAAGGGLLAAGGASAEGDSLATLFESGAPHTIELGHAGGANMARGTPVRTATTVCLSLRLGRPSRPPPLPPAAAGTTDCPLLRRRSPRYQGPLPLRTHLATTALCSTASSTWCCKARAPVCATAHGTNRTCFATSFLRPATHPPT